MTAEPGVLLSIGLQRVRHDWSNLASTHVSSPAKNIINLISVLIIWWCPYVEFSYIVARGCLLWSVHSLGKTLLTFACLILYSKAKLAHHSRYLLTSYFCIPVPMMKRTFPVDTSLNQLNFQLAADMGEPSLDQLTVSHINVSCAMPQDDGGLVCTMIMTTVNCPLPFSS